MRIPIQNVQAGDRILGFDGERVDRVRIAATRPREAAGRGGSVATVIFESGRTWTSERWSVDVERPGATIRQSDEDGRPFWKGAQ